MIGLEEYRRKVVEEGGFTLVFLAAPYDKERAATERAPLLELTFNWDPEDYGQSRNFGHLAFEVDDIYATCDRLMQAGVTINRPPRDGRAAFVRSPDNIYRRAPAKRRITVAQARALGVYAQYGRVVTPSVTA